jgi:hypothetical protein
MRTIDTIFDLFQTLMIHLTKTNEITNSGKQTNKAACIYVMLREQRPKFVIRGRQVPPNFCRSYQKYRLSDTLWSSDHISALSTSCIAFSNTIFHFEIQNNVAHSMMLF